jgi:predicted transcriptional regulator
MKLTELLTDCGFTNPESKTLAYFLKLGDAETTSRDIERQSDLRQPEVSIALAALIDKGWVGVIVPTGSTVGRPTKIYWLKVSPEDIYTAIEKDFQKDIVRLNNTLVQLRAAMIPEKSVPVETPPKGNQLTLL